MSNLIKGLLVWAIASLLFFAALSEAIAAPVVAWDPPVPMDDRIEWYEVHCQDAPWSPPLLPNKLSEDSIVTSVPVGTHQADLRDVLDTGKVHDCVAASRSVSLGLRSAPSNVHSVKLGELPAPSSFRVIITIEFVPKR